MPRRLALQVRLDLLLDSLQVLVPDHLEEQITALLSCMESLLCLNFLPHKEVFVGVEGHLLVNLIIQYLSSGLNLGLFREQVWPLFGGFINFSADGLTLRLRLGGR